MGTVNGHPLNTKDRVKARMLSEGPRGHKQNPQEYNSVEVRKIMVASMWRSLEDGYRWESNVTRAGESCYKNSSNPGGSNES